MTVHPTTAYIIASVILLLVSAIATWALFLAIRQAFKSIEYLQDDVETLKKRFQLTPQPKRHTHHNAMTSENLIAMVVSAKRDLAEAQNAIDTVQKIMHEYRSNPNYDPDFPVDAQRPPSPR